MLIPNTSWNSSGDRCLFRQGKTGTVSEWYLKLDLRSCLCSEKHWLLYPCRKGSAEAWPLCIFVPVLWVQFLLSSVHRLNRARTPSLSMTLEDNQCKDKS